MVHFTRGIKLGPILKNTLIKWFQHRIQCIMRISYSSLGSPSCDKFRNPMGRVPSLKKSVVFTVALWKRVLKGSPAFRCHSSSRVSTAVCQEHGVPTDGSHSEGRARKPFSLGLYSTLATVSQNAWAPNMWALYQWAYYFQIYFHIYTQLLAPRFPIMPGFLS